MTYRIGTDVARRAKRYAARQYVSDYERPVQRELKLVPPQGGSFRPLKQELDEHVRRGWVRRFVGR